MKERVEKIDATEIVLSDNELMPGIQKLIEDAIKKGYKKSWVINAISYRWRDMAPKQEKTELEFTDDEKAFFEKIDKFFSDYGQAFVMRASWRVNDSNWQNRDEIEKLAQAPDYIETILNMMRTSTKSMYCIFCREDTITLQKIEKYNKKLFGFLYGLWDPYFINCALNDLFLVDDMPVYTLDSDERSKYYLHTIENNEKYWNFIKKYSYRNTKLNRVAMKDHFNILLIFVLGYSTNILAEDKEAMKYAECKG